MNCVFVQKHLQEFIDQSISTDILVKVENHIAACASCQKEVRSFKQLLTMLSSTPCPLPTKDEWAVLHNAIMSNLPTIRQTRATHQTTRKPSIFTFSRMQRVAALIVVSVITTTLLLAYRFRPADQKYPMVVAVNGTVFSSDNSRDLKAVQTDYALLPGRSIITDSVSSVEIQVDTKSALNLGKNSECRIKNYGKKKAVFALSHGDLDASVSKRKPDELFRVETPNAFCEVIGTRFNVTTLHNPAEHKHITTLIVHEGTVKFGTGAHHVFVKAGNAIAMFGDSLSSELAADDSLIAHLKNNPGLGRLSVLSTPSGATVYIDGTPSGTTPLSTTTTCGPHSIKVSIHNYTAWSDSIVINSITPAVHNVELAEINQTVPSSSDQHHTLFDHPMLKSAVSLINRGMYNEAITVLHRLTGSASTPLPLKAIAYQKLSICYQNSGNTTKAISVLNHIISGPYNKRYKGNALFKRASLYRSSMHDPVNATKDLERYLAKYAKGLWVEEAMLTLAQLYQVSGHYKKAAGVYHQFCNTVKSGTQYEKTLYTLGTIYSVNLAEHHKALLAFNRLLKEKPNSRFAEDALFWKADCQLKVGHATRAIRSFNSYISSYPNGRWVAEVKTRLHKIETAKVQ